MGNLGFMELAVIFIIALLVFGPKKMPELGRSLGKGLREFRRATNDLKASWEEQMREAEYSVQDVKQTAQETRRDINEELHREAKAEFFGEAQNAPPPQEPGAAEEAKSDGRPN